MTDHPTRKPGARDPLRRPPDPAPSEARVDPEDWEWLRRQASFSPDRSSGPRPESAERAARILAALEPAPSDPAPDRIAECREPVWDGPYKMECRRRLPCPVHDRVAECERCHDDGGTELRGAWYDCPDCSRDPDPAPSDRVAEDESRVDAELRALADKLRGLANAPAEFAYEARAAYKYAADLAEAALEPAPPDPAPDRVAEGLPPEQPGDREWFEALAPGPAPPDRVAEDGFAWVWNEDCRDYVLTDLREQDRVEREDDRG